MFMVNTMACKEICLFIKQKVMVRIDIQIIKNDVKFVKYLSNGKELGVLVVDTC